MPQNLRTPQLLVGLQVHSVLQSGAFPEGSLLESQQDAILGQWLLRDVKAAGTLLREAGVHIIDF